MYVDTLSAASGSIMVHWEDAAQSHMITPSEHAYEIILYLVNIYETYRDGLTYSQNGSSDGRCCCCKHSSNNEVHV